MLFIHCFWLVQMYFLLLEIVFYSTRAITAWKVSKYGVISGSYFPVFSPNTGKYGPEITPYLNTFHAVHAKMVENNRIFFSVSPYWTLGFSRKDNIKFSEENLQLPDQLLFKLINKCTRTINCRLASVFLRKMLNTFHILS